MHQVSPGDIEGEGTVKWQDSGYPCLVPNFSGDSSSVSPLIIIIAFVLRYNMLSKYQFFYFIKLFFLNNGC